MKTFNIFVATLITAIILATGIALSNGIYIYQKIGGGHNYYKHNKFTGKSYLCFPQGCRDIRKIRINKQ